jgi:hypothetical protein
MGRKGRKYRGWLVRLSPGESKLPVIGADVRAARPHRLPGGESRYVKVCPGKFHTRQDELRQIALKNWKDRICRS